MAELQPEPGAMEEYEPHLEHDEQDEEEEEEEGDDHDDEEEGEEGIEYGYEYGTGEAVPMDAEAAAEAEAGHHGALPAVQQPLPRTLTLSFQGEAFVFENVSVEKVQAVLFLLGGKELPAGSIPGPSSSSSYSKAMIFSHRMESLMRFCQKRKERNFDKKIRYSVRKEVAHSLHRQNQRLKKAHAV